MKTLDIKAVRAFVLIADLHSFTRAAEALDSTQSGVSLLLKRLEQKLGRRLIERTPRLIRLSAEGVQFLDKARVLIEAHDRAVDAAPVERRRLVIGMSHQLIGAELPAMLTRLNQQDPALTVELRVAGSNEVLKVYDEGALDAAIVLQQDDQRRNGEQLFKEPFGWIASANWERRSDEPLRLATQGETCSLRAMAVRALDNAGIAWTEVFVGKGAAIVGAAALAGLAVAVLARRAAPSGTIDVGPKLGLPILPAPDVKLYSSVTDARARAALRTVGAALRAGVG